MIGIYLVANVAYIAALGPNGVAESDRPAAESVSVVGGSTAGSLIAIAILVSMLCAANGITLTSTRVYFAMANDGIFFPNLSVVHPRFRTPAVATIWSSLQAILMPATRTFEQLLTYVVFAGWYFYALGAASVFVFRRKLPTAERPFLVPGYPVTPLLFVLASFAIVLITLVSQTERGLVGLAVVFMGAPAYYFWRRKTQTASASS